MNEEHKKAEQLAGRAAIFFTVLAWSTAGVSIKLLDWHPMVITGLRSFVAASFILIVRIASPPPKSVSNKPFPLWAAGFGYALAMTCFVIANKLTTAAHAIMLHYGAPVWTALLGWWLLNEKPRWEHWGALALVFGGLVLFFREALGAGTMFGDGLALLSGIFFAAYSVFLRRMKDGNPRDAMLLAQIIGTAICIPFIILYPPALSVSSTLTILFMGSLQIGLGALLFSYGIKRIQAIQVMCIAILEPVLNPIWVMLLTGEKPSISALAGGGIIITAVVASSLIGIRRE